MVGRAGWEVWKATHAVFTCSCWREEAEPIFVSWQKRWTKKQTVFHSCCARSKPIFVSVYFFLGNASARHGEGSVLEEDEMDRLCCDCARDNACSHNLSFAWFSVSCSRRDGGENNAQWSLLHSWAHRINFDFKKHFYFTPECTLWILYWNLTKFVAEADNHYITIYQRTHRCTQNVIF